MAVLPRIIRLPSKDKLPVRWMSPRNRNVRTLAAVETSAVWTLSLLRLERLSPRVVLGWTGTALSGIVRLAVGRIGLRRSATRAPGGRLYARGREFCHRALVLLFFTHPGVGRGGAKLRGFWGR